MLEQQTIAFLRKKLYLVTIMAYIRRGNLAELDSRDAHRIQTLTDGGHRSQLHVDMELRSLQGKGHGISWRQEVENRKQRKG